MRRLGLVCWLMMAGCSANNMNGVGGGGDADGGAGDGGGGGGGGGMTLPTLKYGTYIALGDSISDRGGIGPYFYDVLATDLQAKYPGLTFVHAAKAGAVAGPYSDGLTGAAPTLKTQISGLGSSYAGDVLVTITIGGNDLNAHAQSAILATDDAIRMEFGQDLADGLAELTKPGRLGSGKLQIIMSNIYDFTDGKGDFNTVRCGPGVNVASTRDTTAFNQWNGVMATAAQNVGAAIYDMHANFMGHGYNETNMENVWFAGGDSVLCIHPNAKGHDAIRKSIYQMVTGSSL
jgi:lysophospholipase L1-like esterase